MNSGVRIGELAARCRVTPDTIRFYEREGLLPRPSRNSAGQRIYDEKVAERVQFIRRAHGIGLRLSDIEELLRRYDRGLPDLCRWLSERLGARLRLLEEQIAERNALRRSMVENIERCLSAGQTRCPVLEFLTSTTATSSEWLAER